MTKKKDYEKVIHDIESTRFLGLSVVSVDVDVLEGALTYYFNLGIATGNKPK